MPALLLFLRCALSALFSVAGAAKLFDPRRFRSSLTLFGLPSNAVALAATVIPLIEILVSALLVPSASARGATVAALCLIVVFTGAVVAALRRGRAAGCQCFGRFTSGDIGRGTIARNATIALGAVVLLVATPETGARAWHVPMAWALVIPVLTLCSVAAIQALAARRRTTGRPRAGASVATLVRLSGAPAEPFALPSLAGPVVRLDALVAAGLPVALVFVSPGCTRCRAVEARLDAWHERYGAALTLVVISRGTADVNGRLPPTLTVLLQRDREVARPYGVSGTPAAVLISAGGLLVARAGPDVDAIGALLASGASEPAEGFGGPVQYGRPGLVSPRAPATRSFALRNAAAFGSTGETAGRCPARIHPFGRQPPHQEDIVAITRDDEQGVTRRDFTARVGAAAAGIAIAGSDLLGGRVQAAPSVGKRILGANDRVVISQIGIRGQGNSLKRGFAQLPNVEIKTLCDIDANLADSRIHDERLKDVATFKPNFVQDLRRVLDDKDIDAVTIAIPNHWHALATIWGLQAGKHVYIEKPASHTVWEGRRMVEATKTLQQDRPGRHDEPQPAGHHPGDQVHAGAAGSARSTWPAACASSRVHRSASTPTDRWLPARSTS